MVDLGSSATAASWREKADRIEAIRKYWSKQDPDVGVEDAKAWLSTVSPTTYVGTRHHTVRRFLLARWADPAGQVQVYRRIEEVHRVENIQNLAIKDFYTFIDLNGQKDSTFESVLGYIEGQAKPVVDTLLNSFRHPGPIDVDAITTLAMFAAFQATRTPRSRKETELHGEWFAKTKVAGKVSDEELQNISVVPHQNDGVKLNMAAAQEIMPFFLHRPLTIVYLDGAHLYMCDEPVIVNQEIDDHHSADCFLTDEQIEQRNQRRLKAMSKRRRKQASLPKRIVHFTSTRPTGYGVAEEIVVPISPAAALHWGPLSPDPQIAPPERITLRQKQAVTFVSMANQAMSLQALDWIVSRTPDADFRRVSFPPAGPLLKVCDGVNAASIAVNKVPQRYRPHRLSMPDE